MEPLSTAATLMALAYISGKEILDIHQTKDKEIETQYKALEEAARKYLAISKKLVEREETILDLLSGEKSINDIDPNELRKLIGENKKTIAEIEEILEED